jgi:Gram-negative bacterial TonB protein C-terminal
MRTLLLVLISAVSIRSNANEIAIPKSDTTKPLTLFQQGKGMPLDSNILIVVNGITIGTIRELKKDAYQLYPPEVIKSLNIWKGDKALEKYGEKGRSGVIEFILKDMVITEVTVSEIKNTDDRIFERVEIEASFPGGSKGWRKFLTTTLNPSVPVDNGAPAGQYTSVVQFIVDKDGTISNIKPLTNNGYGMETEVVRVITKGPKWEPAIQNGRAVRAYRKQPVTFQVEDEEIEISTYSVKKGRNTSVQIKVLKTKDDDLEIAIAGGTIKSNGDGEYIIKAEKEGRVLLTIFNKKKKREVGKISLAVTD